VKKARRREPMKGSGFDPLLEEEEITVIKVLHRALGIHSGRMLRLV
jgi:hypothetical protein